MPDNIVPPTSILKKYFGLKEGQDNMAFIQEVKALKDEPAKYRDLVEKAAAELGVIPAW
jgi:hypothetical protein